MRHTPGPWTVTDEDSPLVSDADGTYIAQVFSRTGCDVGSLRPNYAANARLICAAPAMLEALRDAHMGVCNWIPTNANGWLAKETLLRKIDRAIRAATGE